MDVNVARGILTGEKDSTREEFITAYEVYCYNKLDDKRLLSQIVCELITKWNVCANDVKDIISSGNLPPSKQVDFTIAKLNYIFKIVPSTLAMELNIPYDIITEILDREAEGDIPDYIKDGLVEAIDNVV